MTFFDVLDLYWQWYGWHGHHSFSVPLEFFFQFFLSPISSQITRREKQRKKMIPETYWSSDNDITSIIKIYINKTNSTTSNKVTDNEWSEPHEPSKDVEAHLSMSHSCSPFQSLLVTFLNVVEFIPSKSF
jgi:hypothetical protein